MQAGPSRAVWEEGWRQWVNRYSTGGQAGHKAHLQGEVDKGSWWAWI